VTPVNPQTSFQQNVRNLLSTFSQAWRGLTESQRLGWTALAKTLAFTDIFGDTKFLTGNALYVKLNTNLANIGEAAIDTAPAPQSLPDVQLTDVTITQTAGALSAMTADFNIASIPADHQIAIYATPVVGAGINFVKNQFRFIGALSSITAGVGDIEALYAARFGTVMPLGAKVFVRAAVVSEVSGQQGIPTEITAFAG
jgi:hypothetical protein